MATLRNVLDKDRNLVYPITHESAVRDNDGITLDTKVANICKTIDIEDIDSINSAASRENKYATTYIVTSATGNHTYNVGTMQMFSDNLGHVLTQVLTTHYILDENKEIDITSHRDDRVYQYFRSCKINGGTLPTGQYEWTSWTEMSTRYEDEEDITSVVKDGIRELKLSNKSYAPASFSGLGRKYLRKNIVDVSGTNKNVLTSVMVSDANTIYHIQYDYDLNGQTITLPAGCTLSFEGGSIKNGEIVFNGTKLVGLYENCISNCTFDGTIDATELNVSHISDMTSMEDCYSVFSSILNICDIGSTIRVFLPKGTYKISDKLILPDYIELYGEGDDSIIYNTATTGSSKYIVCCSSMPALSTGLITKDTTPHYEVLGFRTQTQDNIIRRDIVKVPLSGSDDYVKDDYAIFVTHKVSDGRYWGYCIERILDVSVGEEYCELTLEHPVIFTEDEISDWTFVTNIAKYNPTSYVKKYCYVHDLKLVQKIEGTTSGYYAISSGYATRWENLSIISCTPCGSNFCAHVVYKNINATCTDGFWDDAELVYNTLYDNVSVIRDGRSTSRQNIGFSISNGSSIFINNLLIDYNFQTGTGVLTSSIRDVHIDGLILRNCNFYTSASAATAIIYLGNSYKQSTINNVKLVNFTYNRVQQSQNYSHTFVSVGASCIVDNVHGDGFSVVDPSNLANLSSMFLHYGGVLYRNIFISDTLPNTTYSNVNSAALLDINTVNDSKITFYKNNSILPLLANNATVVVESEGVIKFIKSNTYVKNIQILTPTQYICTFNRVLNFLGNVAAYNLKVLLTNSKAVVYFTIWNNDFIYDACFTKDISIPSNSQYIEVKLRASQGDSGGSDPCTEFVSKNTKEYVVNSAIPSVTEYENYTNYCTKNANFIDIEGKSKYDTTLGKLVVWNGSAWLDASGVPVADSVKVLKITQTDYDNLQTKDSSTLYVITAP